MSLRYVYGIVPALAAPALESAELAGIGGAPVRAIVSGAIAAATSDVPEDEFGSVALNEHVRDLDWLTPRASAHQRVNARLLELADTVIPLSFGALYRDDDRVYEMLRADAPDRVRSLAELAGRAEWVVTVTRDDADVPSAIADLRALDEEIRASAPGRAFLLEKRRTTVARDASEREDGDVAAHVFEELAGLAERTYREPVADGGRDIVALRFSLLAHRDDDRIDARIASLQDELAPRGYHVRATGPWPAYRFGSLA